jgi:tetratricopeptide (TPR) repeat protein
MLPWPVWFFIIAGFLFCVYRIVSKARIIHQGSKFDADVIHLISRGDRTAPVNPMENLQGRLTGAESLLAEGRYEQALSEYDGLLGKITMSNHPEEFARIMMGTGTCYYMMGAEEEKVDKFLKAEDAYTRALQIYDVEDYLPQHAQVLSRLGSLNFHLSKLRRHKDNLIKAAGHFYEGTRIMTFDRNPEQYAGFMLELAKTYKELAQWRDTEEALSRAAQACNEAIKVYRKDTHAIQYATTMNEFGEVLLNANAFKESLKVFTREEHPESFKRVMINFEEVKRIYEGLGTRDQGSGDGDR